MATILPLQLQDGTVPVAADFMANYQFLADAIDALAVPSTPTASALPRNYGTGCTLRNNAADVVNDLDILPGARRADDDTDDLVLTTTITKRLDALWTEGSGQGGLDAGTLSTNTWYHVWLIKRTDTGVVDALFSTSATNPTLPSSYSRKRPLGSVRTNATPGIRPFVQVGALFLWADATVPLDFNQATGTGQNTVTCLVPTGVNVLVQLNAFFTAATTVIFQSLVPTGAPFAQSGTVWPLNTALQSNPGGGAVRVPSLLTNTSSQIGLQSLINVTGRIATIGWTDPRGRD